MSVVVQYVRRTYVLRMYDSTGTIQYRLTAWFENVTRMYGQ